MRKREYAGSPPIRVNPNRSVSIAFSLWKRIRSGTCPSVCGVDRTWRLIAQARNRAPRVRIRT